MNKEVKHTKPLSPLQAMIKKKASSKEAKKENVQASVPQPSSEEVVLNVDPHTCRNWEYADRPEEELTSINELAAEFADPKIGQKVPCTARLLPENETCKYEIIAGEQRWRAAILAGTKLKIIVKKLSDESAAIEQILENRRDNLSDYAQGMSYAKLLNGSLLKQKEFESILKLSAVQINRLLSFSQVPPQIWDAIGNMKLVSARTASEIRSLIKKDPKNSEIIIALAPQIREGKIGARSLQNEIKKRESKAEARKLEKREVKNTTGRHLFTWRGDSNGNISISFPKNIRNHVNQEAIEMALLSELEKQFT